MEHNSDQEESQKPVSQSACGTGVGNSGGCGTGSCSTGNEISKVQKIHFLVGSKTGAASKFANDVHNYIQAFNTTMKVVKSDIDSGRSSKIVRNFLEIQSRVVISYPIIETQNRHFMFYLWLLI